MKDLSKYLRRLKPVLLTISASSSEIYSRSYGIILKITLYSGFINVLINTESLPTTNNMSNDMFLASHGRLF
jgi:hypothetical protein